MKPQKNVTASLHTKEFLKLKIQQLIFFGPFQMPAPRNSGFTYNIRRYNIRQVSSIMLAPTLNLLLHTGPAEYEIIIPLNVHLLIFCTNLYILL